MIDPATQELLQFLQLHAGEIHVREEVNGKWGDYTLAELPGDKAMIHMSRFIEEGRPPLILEAEDMAVQARLIALEDKVAKALQVAVDFGQVDHGPTRLWVIDQMIRALLGEETYLRWIESYEGCPDCLGHGAVDGDRCPTCKGTGKPYEWETGVSP